MNKSTDIKISVEKQQSKISPKAICHLEKTVSFSFKLNLR